MNDSGNQDHHEHDHLVADIHKYDDDEDDDDDDDDELWNELNLHHSREIEQYNNLRTNGGWYNNNPIATQSHRNSSSSSNININGNGNRNHNFHSQYSNNPNIVSTPIPATQASQILPTKFITRRDEQQQQQYPTSTLFPQHRQQQHKQREHQQQPQLQSQSTLQRYQHSDSSNSIHNYYHFLRNIFVQSSVEFQRLNSVFYDAARLAYQEQQIRRQQRRRLYYNNYINNNNNNNSSPTGIPPFQRQQNQQRQQRQQQQPQRQRQYNGIPISNSMAASVDEFGLPRDVISNYRYDVDADVDVDTDHTKNNNKNNNNLNKIHSYDYILLNNNQERANYNDIYNISNNHDTNNDGWASIGNLDMYLNTLYNYYYNRGRIPVIGKCIVELVTLFFTLLLSIFLFLYIDWNELSKCTNDTTCHKDFFQSYIIKNPLSYNNQYHWTIWKYMVIMYCILFFVYFVLSIVSCIHTIQDSYYAKWVFEERLGINERKLIGGAVDWDNDIVTKLIQLQQTGKYRISIVHDDYNTAASNNNDNNNDTDPDSTSTIVDTNHDDNNSNDQQQRQQQPQPQTQQQPQQQQLNALRIANHILRKENFLIALFNRGYLDLTVPFLPYFHDTNFYCSSIEWSIYYCIFNFMFNHKYELRPSFYMEPGALRRRFQICGIVHLVFMPFLLFFMTLYFSLQNAYDWKSTKQYLGPREWSCHAKWMFREFNELQHYYERRLLPSYEAAEQYISLFGSSEIIAAFGRIFVFIGGSLGIVILSFAAINDAILLHVKIADWNLLWYAGIVGAIYSIGKAMIPDAKAQPKMARNLFAEMDEALVSVANHTHYYPPIWKGRGWEQNTTYKTFTSMYQYKARLFVMEILSLILSPYILCVSLANCSESICEFILAIRTNIPGAGDVCGYATFDFTKFGDESFEGRTMGIDNTAHNSNIHHHDYYSPTTDQSVDPLAPSRISLADSILETGNVEEAVRRFPTPKARYGKMEKSYFSFKSNHPSWQGSESSSGQLNFLGHRINPNNTFASDAYSREQQLHREAAARQLETLRQLEVDGQASATPIRSTIRTIVNDSYLPRTTTTTAADAGGGPFHRMGPVG